MGYLLGQTLGIAAVGFVLWMTGASWLRAQPRLPLPEPRWAGCLLLGALAWTGYLFLLGTLGLLGPTGVLAGLALVGCARILTGRREAAPAVPGADARLAPGAGGAERVAASLFALLVGALFALLLLVAANPSPAWDAQAYHLTVPKLWLAAGRLVRVPLNV